jgi:hypothetical protein
VRLSSSAGTFMVVFLPVGQQIVSGYFGKKPSAIIDFRMVDQGYYIFIIFSIMEQQTVSPD